MLYCYKSTNTGAVLRIQETCILAKKYSVYLLYCYKSTNTDAALRIQETYLLAKKATGPLAESKMLKMMDIPDELTGANMCQFVLFY